ncbi:hypothetical protein SHXM_00451 [Streptomyces hygroscopicus]|nr:hypothetical protein SHXM_00451 [Streptomyces hygroscopicus]
MLTFSMPLRRTLHFDPRWMHLRATAVTMATVLGTYGCARLIGHKAGLRVDSIVQCVVIASALGRIQRVLDRTDRLPACAVLPCAAAGGTELTTLIQRHPQVGDVAFVLAMAGSIWLRRSGLRATRVGTLVVLPPRPRPPLIPRSRARLLESRGRIATAVGIAVDGSWTASGTMSAGGSA